VRRPQPDELLDEPREARVDLAASRLVQLGVAADLEGVGLRRVEVVDQQRDLPVLLDVAPLLAGGEVDAADVDGVLLRVVAVRQRDHVGPAVGPDGGQPGQRDASHVLDLGVGEHAHGLIQSELTRVQGVYGTLRASVR
jgi:hypothetical protein